MPLCFPDVFAMDGYGDEVCAAVNAMTGDAVAIQTLTGDKYAGLDRMFVNGITFPLVVNSRGVAQRGDYS
jgi:hypothetical protein